MTFNKSLRLCTFALFGFASLDAHCMPDTSAIEVSATLFTLSEEAAKAMGLQTPDGEAKPAWPCILNEELQAKLVKLVNDEPGCKTVSLPRVTTRSSERAILSVVQEFRYPTKFEGSPSGVITPVEFTTRNIGVSVDLEATLEEEGIIALEASPEVSTFQGWAGYKNGETATVTNGNAPQGGFIQPIFGTNRFAASAPLRSGQTLVMGGLPWFSYIPLADSRKEISQQLSKAEPSLLFILVTANVVEQPKRSVRKLTPDLRPLPTPAPVVGIYPYGIPISGKPGFVASPFAPTQGHVDLRGFERGMEVKDPYTGKVFLVP